MAVNGLRDTFFFFFYLSNKHIPSVAYLTFQAEPNILPFDPGDSRHVNVLRWQRVDGL